MRLARILILLGLFSGVAQARPQELKVPDILDAGALKTSVDPCQDFYRFACGRWIDETKIPADKDQVMHQSTAVLDKSDEKLRDILVKLSKGAPTLRTAATPQLLDYYGSCMTMPKTTAAARSLLAGEVAPIRAAQTKQELARLAAKLQLGGTNAFFNFGSGQDLASSNDVIGFLDQGVIGLPEPSYYFKDDPKSVEIRNRYREHVGKILTLAAGESPHEAASDAKTVLAFETELASKAYSFDDRQDPSKVNHPMTREELKKLAPEFDWTAFFSELEAPESKLNVNEPEFFAHLSELLAKTSLADLKTYLVWQLAHRSASSLSPVAEREDFAFWLKYLHGEKKMKPQWKRCTQAVEHHLGYALAEVYVKTIDAAAIKAKIEAMIDWIKQTFSDDLGTLSSGGDAWLDADTKQAAVEKLSKLGQKVGAPEKWRDYSSLKTDRSSYLANDLKASEFESRRDLRKIGKPVDRTEWDMMPWEFNAYYDPPKNEFVFPFGILQPPSFDLKASDGANLGAFGGGTVGHELTHGYDNNGRQYDSSGNLKDWWSPETKKRFEEKSACFIKQADAYKIAEVGLNVDGKKTLPENLADQGGVKLGYAALALARARQLAVPAAGLTAPAGARTPAPWLGRYNEAQQYWIAYAQSWCTKETPEALRVLITTNEHPPEEFRVNGVLMNRPEFARDFACKAGDRMAPANRCAIW